MQTQRSAGWPTSALIATIVLGLLLVVSGAWGFFSVWRMARLNSEINQLGDDLTAAESRIDALEADLEAAQDGSGGLGDLLSGLLGQQGGDLGNLEDLFNRVLGGEGGSLGDLFGGLGPDAGLMSCLTTGTDGLGSIQINQTSLEAQVDDIARAVEEIRGLSFPEEISPVFVTPAEMSERVRALAAESYVPEVVEFDQRLLVALRMLDPGYGLFEAQLDLLDTGVAGYYDPETGELVIATPEGGEPLSAIDQITLSHEMIHELTDARLGFPPVIEDVSADPEEFRAAQALVEGDATLGMQHYSLAALDLQDQLGMASDPRVLGAQQEAADFPYVLQSGLQLPYLEGMNFVCGLYSHGGWDAVDHAYDQPPTTTAEILFPDRYYSAIEVLDPDPVGNPDEGWELLDEKTFGAVDLLTIFSAPGDDVTVGLSDPRERVRAWAGGTVAIWTRGEETAVGLVLVDNGEGSVALCHSITEWEDLAFPAASDSQVVVCDGDQVRVGIAPSPRLAQAIASGRS